MAWTGKAVVVLLAREPLFLGGGHDPAVDHQGRGRVVIERRDAENGGHDHFPPITPHLMICSATARPMVSFPRFV